MQSTLHKDKVFLDVSDSPELAELIGRKEVGDKIQVKEATLCLDEKADGVCIFSIDDIKVKGDKGDVEDDKDEAEEEPTSVQAMKSVVGSGDDAELGPAENPEKEGAVS